MKLDEPWLNYLWSIIASLAGAVTSLAFRSWQGLTKTEIAMAVFVGTTFAFFVSPLVFQNIGETRASGGLFYLMATGWNVLLPYAIHRLKTAIGGEP